MALSNREKEQYIKRAAIFATEISEGKTVPDIVNSKEYHYDGIPNKLFKYCRVNKNSISAIREQYWWISDIGSLDDQFETTVQYVKNPDLLERAGLEEELTDYVIDRLSNGNPAIKHLYKEMKKQLPNGFDLNLLAEKTQRLAKDEKEREKLSSIKSLFNNDEFIKANEALLGMIIGLDKEIGLCSLSETNKSQIMWQMYGNNYKGIVIEYDLTNLNTETKFSLIPVIYSDSRNADPLKLYIDLMLDAPEKTKKHSIRSLFEWILRVISTKNNEWELQKEWRLIGKPNTRFAAAPISAVYIGKKIAKTNREKILRLARKKHFKVYEQSENYEKMVIQYNQVL